MDTAPDRLHRAGGRLGGTGGTAMVTEHGRHRRRRNRRAVLLGIVALVVLVGGGTSAALILPGRGAPAAGHAGTASSASEPDRTSQAVPGTTAARTSTGPVTSLASPAAGASIPLGGTPQYAQVAPDGTFAYVTDPAAGTIARKSVV